MITIKDLLPLEDPILVATGEQCDIKTALLNSSTPLHPDGYRWVEKDDATDEQKEKWKVAYSKG